MERPEITNIILNGTLSIESFQNKTLRPILKMKNDLLIYFISNTLKRKDKNYLNLNREKKDAFVQAALTKDIKLNTAIKGIVIGQFTLEELEFYETNQKEISKRIIQMMIERFLDQTS